MRAPRRPLSPRRSPNRSRRSPAIWCAPAAASTPRPARWSSRRHPLRPRRAPPHPWHPWHRVPRSRPKRRSLPPPPWPPRPVPHRARARRSRRLRAAGPPCRRPASRSRRPPASPAVPVQRRPVGPWVVPVGPVADRWVRAWALVPGPVPVPVPAVPWAEAPALVVPAVGARPVAVPAEAGVDLVAIVERRAVRVVAVATVTSCSRCRRPATRRTTPPFRRARWCWSGRPPRRSWVPSSTAPLPMSSASSWSRAKWSPPPSR